MFMEQKKKLIGNDKKTKEGFSEKYEEIQRNLRDAKERAQAEMKQLIRDHTAADQKIKEELLKKQ